MHLNLVDYFYNCGRFEDFKLCNFENVISKVSGFLKENGDKRLLEFVSYLKNHVARN